MFRSTPCVFLLALVLSVAAAAVGCCAQADAGRPIFVSLFDGNDLSGWQVTGAGQKWLARDGLLVCSGEGRGWLRSDKQYRDFVIRLDYRLQKGGNSGVFLRAAVDGDPSFTGMQVQIYDDADKPLAGTSTCAIVGSITPRVNASLPAGEWNHMEISCIGAMVTVRLNGRQALRADIADPALNAPLKPENKLAGRVGSGYIGLQNHGLPLEFRGIEICEIK
jgi:hypothetical protein